MRSHCTLYLYALLAGSVARTEASAQSEAPADDEGKPTVTVKVVEGGESTVKARNAIASPESCSKLG